MKTILFVSAMLLTITLATPVFAGCLYNGKEYPTGARVGPLVCTSNGTWQPIR
jgi:hypothetical protein